jgi:hypothetical protein
VPPESDGSDNSVDQGSSERDPTIDTVSKGSLSPRATEVRRPPHSGFHPCLQAPDQDFRIGNESSGLEWLCDTLGVGSRPSPSSVKTMIDPSPTRVCGPY